VVEAGVKKMNIISLFKKLISHPVLLLVCRLFLAYIFIYAAINKILDPQSFVRELLGYRFFPDFLVNLIALGLPALELLTGLAIIAGPYIREAALWLMLLVIGFGFGMISAMARGLNIECGCGVPGGPALVSWFTLLRDFVFLVAAVIVFVYPQKQMKITIQLKPESKGISFSL
jgi:putative oxidoreductase